MKRTIKVEHEIEYEGKYCENECGSCLPMGGGQGSVLPPT